MNKEEIIDTLNDLIAVCNDGKEGFKACAHNAKIESLKLRTLLAKCSLECELAADALIAMVRDEGGVPVTGTTASGTLHRGWLNVKTAITGKTDRAVLEECERGEDVAKSAYLKALAKAPPPHIRLLVERQYQGVLNNHEQIKALRDEAKSLHV
jgi:uncharacterized protein (TIGR02284 family)